MSPAGWPRALDNAVVKGSIAYADEWPQTHAILDEDPLMSLQYLDFDYSEDEEGFGTFDAMASVATARYAALQMEVAQVLDWAWAAFPDQCAPLDEGGEWDFLIEAQREWSQPEVLVYDGDTRRFSSQLGDAGPTRHTLTLTLSGSPQFCEAFRQRFGLQ